MRVWRMGGGEEMRMSLLCNTVQSPGGWPLCLPGRAVVSYKAK